jgi:hypothetical protein
MSFLDRLATRDQPIYGLNQGLGALRQLPVSADDNRGFQVNILSSHAVGVGEPYRAGWFGRSCWRIGASYAVRPKRQVPTSSTPFPTPPTP